MYKLTAFAAVAENFTAHFGISISPYFDRLASNSSGKLQFLAHKFVKYLMRTKGYEGSAVESLEHFICQKYNDCSWKFLKKLM